MSHFLGEENAFSILGLSSSATDAEISKRIKEMKREIHIDETPKYDIDSKTFTSKRTTTSVADAEKRLANKNQRLKERFFGFDFTHQEKSLNKLLNAGENEVLISELKNLKITSAIENFHRKKNLALISTLLLSDGKCVLLNISNSLQAWKEVYEDTLGWKTMAHEYEQVDGVINKQSVNAFKDTFVDNLAEIYTYLSKKYNNNVYGQAFQKIFGVTDNTYEEFGAPLINEIIDAVENLEKSNMTEDNILNNDEKKSIDDAIALVTHNLEELNKRGYYDLSKTKAARDKAVESIQIISLELHTKLGEIEWAIKLTDFAKGVVASEQLKSKINNEFIIISIIKTLKDLSTLDATADGVLDDNEKKVINDSVMFLKNNFTELKKMDSYDTAIIRKIRDAAANVIKNMAVELTIELHTVDRSKELITFAKSIVSDNELKDKLDQVLQALDRLQQNKPKNDDEGGCLGFIVLAVVGLIVVGCMEVFAG